MFSLWLLCVFYILLTFNLYLADVVIHCMPADSWGLLPMVSPLPTEELFYLVFIGWLTDVCHHSYLLVTWWCRSRFIQLLLPFHQWCDKNGLACFVCLFIHWRTHVLTATGPVTQKKTYSKCTWRNLVEEWTDETLLVKGQDHDDKKHGLHIIKINI